MAQQLAKGNHSVTCRCGRFATFIMENETIRRVECSVCGPQTLYGDELER